MGLRTKIFVLKGENHTDGCTMSLENEIENELNLTEKFKEFQRYRVLLAHLLFF